MKKTALIIGLVMVVFLTASVGLAAPRDGHRGHGGTYYSKYHGGHGGHYIGHRGYARGYYGYHPGYVYTGGPYLIGGSGIYLGLPFGPGLFFRAYPY